ncbi:hypothetical protein KFU94_63905 [Chloroflexi bacterium TSY]|nr:hypothetical protein [Chloroflexi bacterium TSY]
MSENEPQIPDLRQFVQEPSFTGQQLLLIDPPENVQELFTLPNEVAVIFSGQPNEVELPLVQTRVEGVAHIRIGQHFLDIYAYKAGNIIHFPALGLIWGGNYGSDAILPLIAPESDGLEELQTLRLLADLVKQPHLQVFIPRIGTIMHDRITIMDHLASDVSYLHGVRRDVPQMVERGELMDDVLQIGLSLLPTTRCSALCQEIHQTNLTRLYTQFGSPASKL